MQNQSTPSVADRETNGALARPKRAALLALCAVTMGFAASASAKDLDCPLRDRPYSIDIPLVDILLKPEAKAVVMKEAPALLKDLPPQYAKTTAPTLAAINTLGTLVHIRGLSGDILRPVDRSLASVPITDADRAARCARYDDDDPHLTIPSNKPRILVFQKVTGFRDGAAIEAANTAIRTLASKHGWGVATTDKAGAITPETLKQFDAVIWNNVSGDVLTMTQRDVLKDYVEKGGGWLGIHLSNGDPVYYWDWYVEKLIGARSIGHPNVQSARLIINDSQTGVGKDLAPGFSMKDEWYSFETSPRATGADVIATIDEGSYAPKNADRDLKMGTDHPITWAKCVGNGRSLYTALGHAPEAYADGKLTQLLESGVAWAAGAGATVCKSGKEVKN